MSVYLKETYKDLISFLDELDISNFSCFGQKLYIIKIRTGRGLQTEDVEVYVTDNAERTKLNHYLRSRINDFYDKQ